MKGGNVCIELFTSSLPLIRLQPALQFKIEPIGEITRTTKKKKKKVKREKNSQKKKELHLKCYFSFL
jgi:hypothetical protein